MVCGAESHGEVASVCVEFCKEGSSAAYVSGTYIAKYFDVVFLFVKVKRGW